MRQGKKKWFIPDCELPDDAGGLLKSHESVVILNTSKKDAKIIVTLYFSNELKHEGIIWNVPAERVGCFRTNNLTDMCGFVVEENKQYAISIVSTSNIIVQYGRLDNRQTNLAYYTTMAF